MRTILLLIASFATAAFGAPTYQGQFHGNGEAGFGNAVASDGQVMVISSFSGVYFYQWNGSTWSQTAHVNLGASATGLAIYKTSALAKTPDTLFAFEQSGGVWNVTQKIPIVDGTGYVFSQSVALYTNTAVVGAPNYNSGVGHAYVLSRTTAGSPWGIVQVLNSPTSSPDYFGGAVNIAVAGTTHYLLAGAPYANTANGTVYGYQQSGTIFVPAGSIVSPASGTARFGSTMSGSGASILIGSPATGGFVGSANVYSISFSGGVMSAVRVQNVPAASGATFLFGNEVAYAGTFAIITSPSTLTYYPVSGGLLGAAVSLTVPAHSTNWGYSLTAVGSFTFVGDSLASGGSGAVSWYK